VSNNAGWKEEVEKRNKNKRQTQEDILEFRQ
jgi:hypothetical protein